VADTWSTPDSRQGQPRTNKRQCGIQPAHQSLITDVFRSRPLLCTIHPKINFTLASVKNVSVVPAVLDKGHQRDRLRFRGERIPGPEIRVGPFEDLSAFSARPRLAALPSTGGGDSTCPHFSLNRIAFKEERLTD
jgi:hypothetical protein